MSTPLDRTVRYLKRVHATNEKNIPSILKSSLEPKKTLLDRIAYHISPKKFSQFKIFPKSGMGTNFYGPGVYLAYDEGTIDSFEKQMREYYDNLYRYRVAISPDAKIIDEGDLINYLPPDISEDDIPKELMSRSVDGMNYFNDEDGNSVVIYNPDVLRILR